MFLAEVVVTDFWFAVIGVVFVDIIILWLFWMIMSRKIISRQEVQDMIMDNIINKPEIQEMIDQRNTVVNTELRYLIEAKNELTDAMKKTTEAVNELKLELTAIRGQYMMGK